MRRAAGTNMEVRGYLDMASTLRIIHYPNYYMEKCYKLIETNGEWMIVERTLRGSEALSSTGDFLNLSKMKS